MSLLRRLFCWLVGHHICDDALGIWCGRCGHVFRGSPTTKTESA